MEEKIREILWHGIRSHYGDDFDGSAVMPNMVAAVSKRLAAIMEQGCDGCSYKRSQLDGLISVQCLGCSYNYPSHYTPTEPKE